MSWIGSHSNQLHPRLEHRDFLLVQEDILQTLPRSWVRTRILLVLKHLGQIYRYQKTHGSPRVYLTLDPNTYGPRSHFWCYEFVALVSVIVGISLTITRLVDASIAPTIDGESFAFGSIFHSRAGHRNPRLPKQLDPDLNSGKLTHGAKSWKDRSQKER